MGACNSSETNTPNPMVDKLTDEISTVNKVTVYYWPMLGRAGAAVRILEHAKVPYEYKSEFADIAALGSAFGATVGDTFAPPIVQDGDFTISQSIAVVRYVGTKVGLAPEGMANVAKGDQYMLDMIDLFEGAIAKNVSSGGKALKEFLEGDRFAKLAANLERGVKGKFFFGDSPTYVDFFLVQHMDWTNETVLNRLKSEKGVDAFAKYPKLVAAANGIRELASYKEYAGGIITVKNDYLAKDEVFADYN